MFLLLGSFIAGLLTVIAPCVLPLLPVIIGGSVSGDATDSKRPYIIIASLSVSLILFTLLLKATTLLINIPPESIRYLSGGIIIALGLLTLFPLTYANLMASVGIEQRAQGLLGKGFAAKNSWKGPVIIGAALGPVFSSCSPVYGYILANILPGNFIQAMILIIFYVLGLSAILLLISAYGQKAIRRLKFASNPRGWFQRAIAILFIVVGLLVFTGTDKSVQTWVSNHTPFNFDQLSASLIPESTTKQIDGAIFNVVPYDAPELTGLTNWINSNPQTLKDLRGKVVLVDFWTYSCINCIRSVPYVQSWYDTYKDQGFVALGIHAPEFAFEKVPKNVEKAVGEYKLTYPIAMDNDKQTWAAFENQYWPAHYLIDQEGKVRRVHFGEGEYDKTETAIRTLLEEKGAKLKGNSNTPTNTSGIRSDQTAETYLGSLRVSNYVGSPAIGAVAQATFMAASSLNKNQWTLGGTWRIDSDMITAQAESTLTFKTSSKDVYLVAGSDSAQTIDVSLDGKPISMTDSAGADIQNSQVTIGDSKLYRLVAHPNFSTSTLQLTVPAGTHLSVFTFGS